MRDWSPTELRYLWFLIGDSFLVVLFSLLPVPLLLAGWSEAMIWGFCNGLLGLWFVIANIIAIGGEFRDRRERKVMAIPLVTPILFALTIVGVVTTIALLLSAFDILVPRGQAIYVLALMILLGFGAMEFMFFVARASFRGEENK